MNLLKKILLTKLLYNYFINFRKLTTMKNFEILNSTQLSEVKGGANELTQKDMAEDCIV